MTLSAKTVFGLKFKNPVLNASGCLGFGLEFAEYCSPEILGGLVTKAVTITPRDGNLQPRIAEFKGGMINSIGLENPGVESFCRDYYDQMTWDTNLIVNLAGKSPDEYCDLLRKLKHCGRIAAFEINVSCPNAIGGIEIGTSPELLRGLLKKIRKLTEKPLIIKLSPLVTDIAALALICQEEGADGLTLINTLKGVAFDAATGKPVLGNVVGGISGPCLKPLAVYCVYKVREKVSLPIIGCGGIDCALDVREFLIAGADLVEIGTAAFQSPWKLKQIIDDLN
ncbi:MAG: dihydroorotate dehydrogenase [Candidatus Wallbacteria bacterium]|nr:dihydroorotate dehydrogenase [Candidatus Wallbacteria bacterium]